MRCVLLLCAVLIFAGTYSPVFAGQNIPAVDICYSCSDDTIAGLTNLIAYLESNPDVDDDYKGPIIALARARLLALRGALGPQLPVSALPCCYTRRPIYIR